MIDSGLFLFCVVVVWEVLVLLVSFIAVILIGAPVWLRVLYFLRTGSR